MRWRFHCSQNRAIGKSSRFIYWFADIGLRDVPLVGGKNASLGELHRELKGVGVRVPDAVLRTTRLVVEAEGSRATVST